MIDPFPISLDSSDGPALLAASEDDGAPSIIAIDVLTPITVLDSFRGGGSLAVPARRVVELTLIGLDNTGAATVPRVRFPDTAIFDMHPCGSDDTALSTCKVGLGASAREVFGVLGADILSDAALRFDFPTSEMRFFPDAAGSVGERTVACDAVYERPFGGGGTLLIGGGEVRYGRNRPTLGACIHHEAIAEPEPTESERGTDMHLAISTAHGPTILSESAYLRYLASTGEDGGLPALEALPSDTLHLLSGPVPVRMGEVAYAAFVGVVGEDSDRRGPCRELYANARMRVAKSCSDSALDCPCPDSRESCKAAAAVEVNRPIRVAIVADTLPLLQALRDELRPSSPELDGVIGMEALQALRVEFDFPNNRILMRCLDTEFCTTRPQVRSQNDLGELDLCRASEEANRPPAQQDAGPLP